jgi:hypothetical protein
MSHGSRASGRSAGMSMMGSAVRCGAVWLTLLQRAVSPQPLSLVHAILTTLRCAVLCAARRVVEACATAVSTACRRSARSSQRTCAPAPSPRRSSRATRSRAPTCTGASPASSARAPLRATRTAVRQVCLSGPPACATAAAWPWQPPCAPAQACCRRLTAARATASRARATSARGASASGRRVCTRTARADLDCGPAPSRV